MKTKNKGFNGEQFLENQELMDTVCQKMCLLGQAAAEVLIKTADPESKRGKRLISISNPHPETPDAIIEIPSETRGSIYGSEKFNGKHTLSMSYKSFAFIKGTNECLFPFEIELILKPFDFLKHKENNIREKLSTLEKFYDKNVPKPADDIEYCYLSYGDDDDDIHQIKLSIDLLSADIEGMDEILKNTRRDTERFEELESEIDEKLDELESRVDDLYRKLKQTFFNSYRDDEECPLDIHWVLAPIAEVSAEDIDK